MRLAGAELSEPGDRWWGIEAAGAAGPLVHRRADPPGIVKAPEGGSGALTGLDAWGDGRIARSVRRGRLWGVVLDLDAVFGQSVCAASRR
jgi:hypothetical protein